MKRSRAACTTCHRRKVKCDAHDVGLPCSNCRQAVRKDCQIHQKRKRVSRSAHSKALRTEKDAFDGFSINTPNETLATTSPAGNITVASSSAPQLAITHDEDQGSSRSTPASTNLAWADIHAEEDGEYIYKRHFVEFIDQPELVDRPIDSKARMTFIGTDVSNTNFLVQHQFGTHVRTTDVFHYPTNRIARRMGSHGPADRLPLDAFQLPQKARVDKLLDVYFRHVNPGFPVVDEQIFMQQYRAKDSLNPPSLLLLHAILVVGAHVLYGDDQEKRNSTKAAYFRRAKILFDAGFERNRDTVVQAALLLTWHTDGVEDVVANAWFWLGVAVRTAMGLGMHCDADGSTLVPHNKRMWRRVWWLLFQSDVWVAVQYGRPQSIHLEDSSVQTLKSSDFAHCGDDVKPEYVIQMTQLSIIVSEAIRARFRAVSAESRRAALQQTDERLASWALRLPQQLHLHSTSGSTIWTANLHLHYNMALILLHRSQPHSNPENDTVRKQYDENTEICVAAAATIQSLFQNICEADSLKCLWMSTINCIFTALIQLSAEIRLSNPLLAISALRRYDSALVSLKKLARYWPNAQSILHFFEKSVRMNATAHESGAGHVLPAYTKARPELSVNSPVVGTVDAHKSPTALEAKKPYRDDARETCSVREGSARNLYSPALQSSGPFDGGQRVSNRIGATDGNECDVMMRNSTEERVDGWKEWQNQHWHTPEFSDDFSLFTF
ncbi:hypothetical protein jhhlp_005465 [Lomentospora prolificans]|uniref:Zn(2)-C6 fungal-type domain-containing protein n=1 Tax=Lomentospora prolificans TaxID=41688 RepID=A0A2N3N6X6_9PEZI|nr:hypothetical protein jhhlp_005465 [Lomentospora prolificans]